MNLTLDIKYMYSRSVARDVILVEWWKRWNILGKHDFFQKIFITRENNRCGWITPGWCKSWILHQTGWWKDDMGSDTLIYFRYLLRATCLLPEERHRVFPTDTMERMKFCPSHSIQYLIVGSGRNQSLWWNTTELDLGKRNKWSTRLTCSMLHVMSSVRKALISQHNIIFFRLQIRRFFKPINLMTCVLLYWIETTTV